MNGCCSIVAILEAGEYTSTNIIDAHFCFFPAYIIAQLIIYPRHLNVCDKLLCFPIFPPVGGNMVHKSVPEGESNFTQF